MTSQVVVNIDTDLKNKAMAMAKKQGLTMKALLSFFLEGYIKKDIEIGVNYTKNRRETCVMEIEPLTKEERDLLMGDSELEKKRKRLNKLITAKGI